MALVILVTRVRNGEETLVGAAPTATGAMKVQDLDLIRCFDEVFSDELLDVQNERHVKLFHEISYTTEFVEVK